MDSRLSSAYFSSNYPAHVLTPPEPQGLSVVVANSGIKHTTTKEGDVAKRKRVINERVIKRRLKEGRGQGRGAHYQPWPHIQDVPSQGLATRIKGWKTGRCHHFLSKLECQYFYVLEWSPIVFDIREQYPLELAETLAIAERLGVAHPTDPRTRQPIVMTTDFVNTINQADKLIDQARSIKYSQELSSDRTLHPLQM